MQEKAHVAAEDYIIRYKDLLAQYTECPSVLVSRQYVEEMEHLCLFKKISSEKPSHINDMI
jgi:hypothetical protein